MMENGYKIRNKAKGCTAQPKGPFMMYEYIYYIHKHVSKHTCHIFTTCDCIVGLRQCDFMS